MKQNVYDNPTFFNGYMAMREAGEGLNEVLEQPAMKALMPSVEGKSVLDLGCGAGDLCQYLYLQGAGRVTGVDISAAMVRVARTRCPQAVELVTSPIEDFTAEPLSYDLVISSLALHYIADLPSVFARIAYWMIAGGTFLFSMEHPIATSGQGITTGWARDRNGQPSAWLVDAYAEEGKRESKWFVDGVIKYHRKVSTLLNTLIAVGLVIQEVAEPTGTREDEIKRPGLLEERKRPPFFLVKAIKPAPEKAFT